jgi:MarR family transcriptional regulator, organic hydroperoxide resistance regulator
MRKKKQEIEEVINNLRRIFQVINQYSREAERETALTGPQLWALQVLVNSDGLRVSELAAQMYLRPATVVGILDRLEAKGLVTRTRSTTDRRAVELALTQRGQEVVAKAPQLAQVMLLKGLQSLSEEERAVVVQGMQHMVRILGAETLPPLPLLG